MFLGVHAASLAVLENARLVECTFVLANDFLIYCLHGGEIWGNTLASIFVLEDILITKMHVNSAGTSFICSIPPLWSNTFRHNWLLWTLIFEKNITDETAKCHVFITA